MKRFLTLLFLTLFLQSFAQQSYRRGLIVTQTADTILCFVPITSSFGNQITIKKVEDGYEERVAVNTIKYLVTETNVYENVSYLKKGKKIRKLMWLEIEGKLNLYLEIEQNAGSSRSFAGGTLINYGSPTKTYIIRKADNTYLIGEKSFIEDITPLINDNQELIKKVENKMYSYENIERLVKEYNNSP